MNVTGWGKNLARSSSHDERVRLVEASNETISIKRQCQLLQVNRSSVYRLRVNGKEESCEQDLTHGESSENLELMRRLDELHLEHPAWGYRKMTDYFLPFYICVAHDRIIKNRCLWRYGYTSSERAEGRGCKNEAN